MLDARNLGHGALDTMHDDFTRITRGRHVHLWTGRGGAESQGSARDRGWLEARKQRSKGEARAKRRHEESRLGGLGRGQ